MSSTQSGSDGSGSASRRPADEPATKTRLRRGEINRQKRPTVSSGANHSEQAGDAEDLIYGLVDEDLAGES